MKTIKKDMYSGSYLLGKSEEGCLKSSVYRGKQKVRTDAFLGAPWLSNDSKWIIFCYVRAIGTVKRKRETNTTRSSLYCVASTVKKKKRKKVTSTVWLLFVYWGEKNVY